MTEREVSSERVSEKRVYLIRKGGAWYRPDSAGYTTSAHEAGRYTLEEAEKITHPNGPNGPRDAMSYQHQDSVPALRFSAKPVGVPIQPLETRPQGEDVMEPSEIEVHEGAWALVMGTNAKAAGWIDTHALFAHQLYRDQILPLSALEAPTPQGAPSEVTEEMRDWSSDAERKAVEAGQLAAFEYSKSGGGPIGVFTEGLRAYRAVLTAALRGGK